MDDATCQAVMISKFQEALPVEMVDMMDFQGTYNDFETYYSRAIEHISRSADTRYFNQNIANEKRNIIPNIANRYNEPNPPRHGVQFQSRIASNFQPRNFGQGPRGPRDGFSSQGQSFTPRNGNEVRPRGEFSQQARGQFNSNQAQQGRDRRFQPYGPNEDRRACYNCGAPGHLARQCPRRGTEDNATRGFGGRNHGVEPQSNNPATGAIAGNYDFRRNQSGDAPS